MLAIIVVAAEARIWAWLHRIGGPAFIVLGFADNSVIPLPGSMDALLIVLSAHRREWWWYYALWATAGSIIGGYLTYRIARAGGKDVLEKKVGKRRADKVYGVFGKYGFASLVFGAMAPPPMPIVPFLMTAGVMQYPRHKFVLALGSGRLARFMIVAWISRTYGQVIFGWISKYYKPAMWTLITLAVVGGIAGLAYYLHWRAKKRAQRTAVPAEAERRAA